MLHFGQEAFPVLETMVFQSVFFMGSWPVEPGIFQLVFLFLILL